MLGLQEVQAAKVIKGLVEKSGFLHKEEEHFENLLPFSEVLSSVVYACL